MSKTYHNLVLAKSPADWVQLDAAIEKHVSTLCGAYDDPAQVEAFLTILDLVTNREYSQGDRDSVAFQAARVAFAFSPEFQEAQEAYMAKIVPVREKRKTA